MKKSDMYLNFKDSPYRRKHKRRILIEGNLIYVIIVILLAFIIGIGVYIIVSESTVRENPVKRQEELTSKLDNLDISYVIIT